MTYKINFEIAPSKLRLLIDLVSDAQNTYAERITMTLCQSCKTEEENAARLQEAIFLRFCYNDYTDLLKMLHEIASKVDAIRPPEADE